jgi:two-component system chemotaxis response regulator CheB
MTAFLRAELFPRLRAIARVAAPQAGSASERPAAASAPVPRGVIAPVPRPEPPRAPRAEHAPDPVPSVLVVGASTGGPRALAAALGELPPDFPLPIAVVQHVPAEMAEFFASGLGANCRMRVALAEEGALLEPGTMWVARGGAHMTLASEGARVRFRFDHGPEQNGCRPSVDPLFRSAAAVFGAGTLALVLTGMGQDGLAGARVVHAAQGRVLVQDEASSVVWGMPGAIARAGLAHAVVPLADLGGELLARARPAGARRPRSSRDDDAFGPIAEAA